MLESNTITVSQWLSSMGNGKDDIIGGNLTPPDVVVFSACRQPAFRMKVCTVSLSNKIPGGIHYVEFGLW
jgi:hypothetical protein